MRHKTDLQKEKIVILVDHFVRAGPARQAYLLARDMRNRLGLDAEVWALSEYRYGERRYDHDYVREVGAAEIPTRRLDFRFPTRAPSRFLRGVQWINELRRVSIALRLSGVDILLPFSAWPNVVAGLCYRLGGVRLCIWGERQCGGDRVPTPERIALKRFQLFAANSTAGVNFLTQEMGVSRERISYIPNAVEAYTPTFANPWRARLRLSSDEPVVVMVASINGFRDHPTLLRAWNIVQQNCTDLRRPFLVLAGNRDFYDSSYQECLHLLRKYDLHPQLRFVDTIADVRELIATADLGVFCSRLEGMPNGLLECMAAGKAVVATDLPGVRDALGPNADECVVPAGDVEQFAQATLQLLNDKARREQLGAANRARACAEFSVETMVDRYLQIIRGKVSAISAEFGSGAGVLAGSAGVQAGS